MQRVPIHDEAAFTGMRKAGRLAAEILDTMTPMIKAGVATEEIDAACHALIDEAGATPAPLGYKGYPKATCISVNHVVCHGIPSNKVLRDGDILNLDVTVIHEGWHGDTSRMYWVGEPSVKAKRLTTTTYEALIAGIEVIKPGATLGDIGHAIQNLAEAERFSVVRDFTGHGLGRDFHAPPAVFHYGEAGKGLELKAGMIFTVEPMINAGSHETKLLADGWTAVTRDRSLSAQFEHSVGVTKDGVEIFTLSPQGLHHPPYA